MLVQKTFTSDQIQQRPTSKLLPVKLKPNTPRQIKQEIRRYALDFKSDFNLVLLSSKNIIEILKYIEKWPSIERLYINQHLISDVKLINYVCQIDFYRLSKLYLQNTNLETIEPLQWINAPNIQCIFMEKNHISTLKPFAKTNFPQLKNIRMDDCFPDNELSYFNRTRFSNLIIFQINVQNRKGGASDIMQPLYPMEHFMKCQSKKTNFRPKQALGRSQKLINEVIQKNK